MPNLPAVNHLTHIDEEERSAGMLLGNLRCSCGSETFRVAHDGRALHALLGDWWDNWLRGAQHIEARCAACGARILLHDGTGSWQLPPKDELAEFVHPRLHDQRCRVRAGYHWEDKDEAGRVPMGSTSYASCVIELHSVEKRRPITLFEYEV